MEYTFTEGNFEKEVLNSDIPVMIDFFATWCMPCKMLSPTVAKLAEKYDGKIKIGKVDSDQEPGLARSFNVMSIPNIVFIKNGKVVDESVGLVPQQVLEAKIEKLIAQ
ncbi:MAG: thioredoxin [Pseudobutyrivibrio sp.]|nr:thioredoxin [Pseudobutyrivibrio sp.]